MLPVCAVDIAEHYEVPYELVQAVAQVESGQKNPGRVGPNKNGTYDLGIMQINTWWLKRTGRYSLTAIGITEEELLTNDCTNIAVGVWVLKQNLNQYGNVKAALSAYNTGKPDSSIGLAYAKKVIAWSDKYGKARNERSAVTAR